MRRLIRYLASMLPLPLAWRAPLYRWSGMSVGRSVTIDRNLHVTGCEHIRIGDRVTLSNGVSLLADVTAVHSRLEQEFSIARTAEVVLEDDVYVGVKATILPGVRVGRMATVAANTLVMSDVPSYGVIMGVPGRVMLIRRHGGSTAEGGRAS